MSVKKKTVKWTADNRQKLLSIVGSAKSGKRAAYEKASKAIGCTVEAAQLAYSRLTRKKKGTTTRKAATVPAVKVTGPNPFKIETDLIYTGNRGGMYNPLVTQLKESVMKLTPNDVRHSVSIPTTVAPTKNDASNMVVNLRRMLADSKEKVERDTTVTLKAIFSDDDSKKYLGSRVWRKS